MQNFSSDEDKLLFARIIDLSEAAERQLIPKFSFFLDERQRTLAEMALKKERIFNYSFFGGYDAARRVVLGIFPSGNAAASEDFPIAALEFSYREQFRDKLSHKDFLGAVMAEQVRRETVGDILVNDGSAVIFAYKSVAELLLGLTKIGAVGVRVSVSEKKDFTVNESFLEIAGTVPSMRLDAVASVATKQSREKLQLYIKANGIDVNHEKIFSGSVLLKQGDMFSIRGQGKFLLSEIGGQSKKGRYHIEIKKYI